MTRTCTSSLLVADILAASGSAALAQQSSYPDLKGTWTGQVQAVAQGKPEHFPPRERPDRPSVRPLGRSSSTGRRGAGSRARTGGPTARYATRSLA